MNRLALILIAILLLAAPAAAQENTLGLSASDALLLATANNTPLTSFAFEYELSYSADLDTFPVRGALHGSGVVDREGHALSATLEGEASAGTTQSLPLDGEMRWIADTLYLNTGDGWQALENAPTAIADRIGEYTGLSADIEALAGWDLLGVDGLNQLLGTIASADPAAFVTAERLEDDGQNAHFRLMADLHRLLDSDAFVDALIALGNAQGSDLMIYSRDEVAEMVRAHNQALEPATLAIDEYIGIGDGFIHRVSVSLYMVITPELGGFSSPPFNVSLKFDMTLSKHNQPQAITIPDDATSVSAFSLALSAPEAPGEGTNAYVFIETLDENATYALPLDLQAGDVVTITARRLSLEIDTIVSLLSPSGERLVENDDHETMPYFTSAYDSQILDYTVPESGTYTVQVADLDGAAGSFILSIRVER